jgi:hypothetical protein
MAPLTAGTHRGYLLGIACAAAMLSGCSFGSQPKPNLRVVVPRTTATAATTAPTTTTIRTQIIDAVAITSGRSATAPLTTVPTGALAPDPTNEEPPDDTEAPAATTAASTTTTTTLPPTTTTTIPATTTTEPATTTTAATTTTTTIAATSTTGATTTTTTIAATTTTVAATSTTPAPTTTTTSAAPTSHPSPSSSTPFGGTKRAADAFATAQIRRDQCLTVPMTCDQSLLAASYSGAALNEILTMIAGLRRTDAHVSIATGDGYVLEYAAVNVSLTQASVSGCFTTVRDTFDSHGQMLTTSTESTREAFELVQTDGVWLVTTHRALGAC